MSTDPTKKKDDHVSTSKALDDEQRVKVLSPGMLVAKRFFRNKLAVAGLVILVAMFLFSFIGGMVSPYNESQVFRKTDHVWKDYAGATYNKSYIFTTANGAEFPAQGQQKFILATNKGNDSFEANDVTYGLEQKGEDYWAIYSSESVATVLTLKGKSTYKQVGNTEITDEIKEGYEEAVANRWALDIPMPEEAKKIVVLDAEADAEKLAGMVDFCFCAVDMKKEDIRALEEKYAKLECPIVSNNSAHRWTDDVPMVVPEINADHIAVIDAQRKRLGTKRGFIAVKSNCSLQSYVPALHPLKKYGLDKVLVCTYQAISGAGKTFARWPEMVDNCIPYIGGEEEKSEQEPLKLWGHIEDGKIVKAEGPSITAQCFRVACQDGHMAAVFMKFADGKAPSMDQIKADWAAFRGPAQELDLPSAPKQFLHYFEEPDRPQTRLDRNLEHGMAVSIGRLRPDTQYDYKFVCLSHNTLRGAAGGAVLLAELLCAKGYMD